MSNVVNTGAAANDGTGDPLRVAFQAINGKFVAQDTEITRRFNEAGMLLVNRGEWAAAMAYESSPQREWVTNGGQAYVATSNHISGANFATDLAAGKWLAVDVAQLITDLAAPSGSSLVGYLPAGTGAVATTVETKLRESVSVSDYRNAAADAGDWTTAIQAALAAVAPDGRVVGDVQSNYPINGRVNIVDKELRDVRLTYTGNNGMLVLGGKARLTNTVISVGSTIRIFADPLPGVVNLHLATGVVIDNVEITDGISNRVGIFCSTLASNTTIRNCRMEYIGWPIWFNDAYPAQRIVDGVDYAGQSIGSGLYISGCALGAADKTAVGDSIEINCPSQRFENIRVVNCTTLKAVSAAETSGIGFGFANCDVVSVSDCLLKGVQAGAGAIHMEAHTSASITGNTIYSCKIGIGIGVTGKDCLISGNTVKQCEVNIQCISNNTPLDGITITGNQLIECSNSHIVMLNAVSAVITNNLLKDITTTGINRQYIGLQQSGTGALTRVIVANNIFSKASGQVQPLLGLSGSVTEVFSSGNVFTGIGAPEITGYMIGVKSVGMSEDHYRASGNTSAINGTITTNPTGFIAGTLGDFMTDVNAGVLYRHDGTNWVSKIS